MAPSGPVSAAGGAVTCGDGTASVPVSYQGRLPDPFRADREVSVKGELRNGVFVAKKDSLVTKCPSKYTAKKDT